MLSPPDHGPSGSLMHARPLSHQGRAAMGEVFDRAIRLAETGRLRLRVPRDPKAAPCLKHMHYHYRPEVFLQLQGVTQFECPQERFELHPDEVCVIPAGVPHGEKVRPEGGRAFRNLVAGFYNHTISLHFAYEAAPQHPDIEEIEFFDAPDLEVYLTLANGLAHTQAAQTPARDAVLKGLLLALLGLFRNIVATGSDRLNTDIGKVFQAKCIVREQYANPDLGVQQIAGALGCSRDYLSHLFHTETNERLTHYIQRLRVEGAVVALETTTMNVSEIAYACGFADPAYFGRVFKQHKGKTPQEYREQLDAGRSRPDGQPKTVYYDRLDFSPGAPAPRSLAATTSAAP